jgi:ribosomal protein S17E
MQTPNLGFGPLPGGYATPNPPGSPQRKRLAVFFVAGAVILALLLLWGITSSHKDPAKADLIKLVVSQNETVRVAAKFAPKLSDPRVKQHNVELQATLMSSSTTLLAEMKRVYGIKGISGGAQKAAINAKTDTTLTSAVSLNQLDQDLASTMSDQLSKELTQAVQAEGEVKNQQTKQILAKIADYLTDLRKRFNDAATALAGGSANN